MHQTTPPKKTEKGLTLVIAPPKMRLGLGQKGHTFSSRKSRRNDRQKFIRSMGE